mmetsp:Transcript_33681/g.41280  ORF Transcript_33681/g.41280 Transcript_33681/m.41280 type:complete len:221 (+) Transcript_33681:474-1136(+)
MQLKIGSIILKIIIIRNLIRNISIQQHTRLVRPTPRHVPYSIPPSTQHERRDPEALHELDAFRVTAQTEVETTETIAGETVRAALQDYRARLVDFHYFCGYWFEEFFVHCICYSRSEGGVYGEAGAFFGSRVFYVPCTRKKVPKLMQTKSHHAIGTIKSLLDAIPVMNVNINIQHPRMNLQQLQNRQHDIINITKPARLALLRVMQPTAPINRNIRIPVI